MIINLVCDLTEGGTLDQYFSFNMTTSWFLRAALEKQGHTCRVIPSREIMTCPIPKADHTLVTSAIAMKAIRKNTDYLERVRRSTKGKLTLYLDAAYAYWDKIFDVIFTVVKPFTKSSSKYVYAGWAADPEYCYPDQRARAVFCDSLMYGFYNGRLDHIYKQIETVFAEFRETESLTIYCPFPDYHNRQVITWPSMQRILRRCHFYVCTQDGEGGLTRIEAATCGALLVVPKPLYRPHTMSSLEHVIWTSRKELHTILKSNTEPEKISRKARAHTWGKVASRILEEL